MSDALIRVLAIEDNPADVRLVREFLNASADQAFEIAHAWRLADGIRMLKTDKPDVVLLDINLPDSHGLATVENVLKEAPGVPVIVLTGAGDEELGIQAVKAHASDYLVKGQIDEKLLARSIRYAIERKNAEDALRESEVRFRSLANNVPSVLLRFDKSLRVEYVSPRARELTGIDFSRFAGKTIEEASMLEDSIRSWADGVRDVLLAGQNKEVEFDVRIADGTRSIMLRLAPEREASGAVEHVLGVATDITDIRRATEVLERDKQELEKLVEAKTREVIATQQEAEKAKRLADMGTLAATVAHELRNPLGAVSLAVYNLRRKAGNPALESHLRTIENKVAESNQIIDNLLFYSRLRQPAYRAVRLGGIIEEALGGPRAPDADKKVTVIRKFDAIADLLIEADPLQIKEMLVNLVNNAYDAVTGDKGTVEVGAGSKGTDVVSIYVKDNGSGIDKDDLDRIWEPFFSTKSKGTGLGLSVCRQIATLHNGTIEIESEKGKGTTATITLPSKRMRHEVSPPATP
jgi:PAS domain S-box-containing protein